MVTANINWFIYNKSFQLKRNYSTGSGESKLSKLELPNAKFGNMITFLNKETVNTTTRQVNDSQYDINT